MNKKQKIQKLFHLDKWWGRGSFIFFYNVIFFPLGTLVYFLFSWVENLDLPLPSGWFSFLYFYILLPVLSFVFIFEIMKVLNIKIKKINLFFLNLIIIIFIFSSLFLIAFYSIKPNFF